MSTVTLIRLNPPLLTKLKKSSLRLKRSSPQKMSPKVVRTARDLPKRRNRKRRRGLRTKRRNRRLNQRASPKKRTREAVDKEVMMTLMKAKARRRRPLRVSRLNRRKKRRSSKLMRGSTMIWRLLSLRLSLTKR
jgi:hypothetical protein